MKSDDLDKALDSALAQYSSAEPLDGLEQRVLNRVRAEGRGGRSGLGRWLLAMGALVLAGLIAMAVLPKRPTQPVAVAREPLGAGLPRSLPIRVPVQVPGLQPAPARKARAKPIRRPAPLTPEERAWLVLAARAPVETTEARLDLESRGVEPIRIEEIKIEPLRSNNANDEAQ
jgi:hypothetical protein